jgi:hypothetical protein
MTDYSLDIIEMDIWKILTLYHSIYANKSSYWNVNNDVITNKQIWKPISLITIIFLISVLDTNYKKAVYSKTV